MAKPGFYAVRAGHKPGIYRTWAEAEAQVKKFQGAIFKKFDNEREALAYVKVPVVAESRNAVASTSKIRPRDTVEDNSLPTQKKLKLESSSSSNVQERLVYCDGSCLGNGQAGSTAGIGVYWPSGGNDLDERLPGTLQTNNRAEMYALARILEDDLYPNSPLIVCTDSEYVMNTFSKWVTGWIKAGWKTSLGPVKNQDIIIYVLALLSARMPPESKSLTGNVSFRKVKAHVGIFGNEEADRLAKLGASKPVVPLRDLAKATEDLKKRLKKANIKEVENFEVFFDETDLFTEDELREMENDQVF